MAPQDRRGNRAVLLLSLLLAAAVIGSLFGGCTGKGDTSADLITDPIKIDSGYISGTVVGEPGKEVRVYRGIPYAASTAGENRWRPPQPVTPWPGVRQCTEYGHASPQVATPFSPGPYSEDCLYLNVTTPAKRKSERLPVMVWFHGGGYSIGSGHNTRTYNWPALPQHGVVLVTVNHRLSVMGLFAHPALSAESPNRVSGNYLFLDLIASLQWVQRNIEAFGGDPKNVTIFGESGGGAKVDALVASPLAKGLFHRAICESGVDFGAKDLKEIEALGEKFVEKLGLAGEKDVLAALRAVPWEKVVSANLELARELGGARRAYSGAFERLAIDGWFMPDKPENIYAQGKQNRVPLITCANEGEIIAEKSFLVMPQLIGLYVKRLEAMRKIGVNAYATIFSQVPSAWKKEGVLAYHGLEIPYVFGDLESINTQGHFLTFAKPSGASQQDSGLTEDDYALSELMMNIWVQFARTGDPNIKGVVTWPVWEPTTDQYLELKWKPEVKSGYSKIAPVK